MAGEKKTFSDLEAQIGTKAMKDKAYRKELLRDPKAVVEKELRTLEPGVQLPESLHVKVHEQEPNTIHLVIPPLATQSEEKVSNERLGVKGFGSITSSDFRKTFLTDGDCGCL
jgi:hypothetical protein